VGSVTELVGDEALMPGALRRFLDEIELQIIGCEERVKSRKLDIREGKRQSLLPCRQGC
jgi:hypothetical protein